MKRGSIGWQILLVLVAAVIGYALLFRFIEHRRVVKGPWQVTFTVDSGAPALVVNQPVLAIRDVRIRFADEAAPTTAPQTLASAEGRPVPFEVPFGRCVFLDTIFQPGTVAFEMFGHEIQLMPHTLTIDKQARPWHSGETITLTKPEKPRDTRP